MQTPNPFYQIYEGAAKLRGATPYYVPCLPETNDLPDFEGISGLRQYLLTQRKADLVNQFCRKLLGYALGRRIILSDRQLLEEMAVELEKNDGRLSAVLLAVVTY